MSQQTLQRSPRPARPPAHTTHSKTPTHIHKNKLSAVVSLRLFHPKAPVEQRKSTKYQSSRPPAPPPPKKKKKKKLRSPSFPVSLKTGQRASAGSQSRRASHSPHLSHTREAARHSKGWGQWMAPQKGSLIEKGSTMFQAAMGESMKCLAQLVSSANKKHNVAK